MTVLYIVVEGHGEVKAAPLLVRRILAERFARFDFSIKATRALGRGDLTRQGGIEYFLEFARRDSECSATLLLIDAEKSDVACPPSLALTLADRARVLNLPFPVAIVCAVCEYESWFLANLEWIRPEYLREDAEFTDDPETECSAKGWLSRHMRDGLNYKETVDQVKMTARLNLDHSYQHLRSFRRMVDAVGELLAAIEAQTTAVTPMTTNP